MFELLLKLVKLCKELEESSDREGIQIRFSMEINEIGRVISIFIRRDNLPNDDKLVANFYGEELYIFKKEGLPLMTLQNINLIRNIIMTMNEMKQLQKQGTEK